MKAAAIELTRGTNPYSADFHGTILEKTAQYNAPGWIKKGQETYLLFSHYPYTPAAFLVTVPFFIFFPSISFYWISVILFLLILVLLVLTVKDPLLKEMALVLTFLNPFIWSSVILGHVADILSLLFMLLFIFFLLHKKYFFSGFFMGLLFLTKLYFLLLLPFLLLYFLHQKKNTFLPGAAASFLLLTIPFLAWDAHSFIDDTLLIYLGAGKDTLYIWLDTAGLFPLLTSLKIIPPSFEWIPTLTMILGYGVILFFFVRKKSYSFSRALVYSTIASIVFLFFTKFFSFNYLMLPFTIMAGLVYWRMLQEKPTIHLFELPK